MVYRGTIESTSDDADCPRCPSVGLARAVHDADQKFVVQLCETCGGAWLGVASLVRLVEEWDARIAASGLRPTFAEPHPPEDLASDVCCPRCSNLMRRYRYGQSDAIVDCCRDHGIWLDRGELGQVLHYLNRRVPRPLPRGEAGIDQALRGAFG